MSEQPVQKPRFFMVKVTAGQERNVARIIEGRVTSPKEGIYSILVLPGIKGYVFIEAESKERVSLITQGIRHVKARAIMPVKKEELMVHLLEKPAVEMLAVGDFVEIISGPLQGISGKVIRVDKPKNEVTIEPADAAFPLPISVPADQVRVVKQREV